MGEVRALGKVWRKYVQQLKKKTYAIKPMNCPGGIQVLIKELKVIEIFHLKYLNLESSSLRAFRLAWTPTSKSIYSR